MKSLSTRNLQRSLQAALVAVAAVSLLVSPAAAETFTTQFGFKNQVFERGSLRAVVSAFRNSNPSLGYELSVDYQGGTLGATAQVFNLFGLVMADAGDINNGVGLCTPGASNIPCRKNFHSADIPLTVRVYLF